MTFEEKLKEDHNINVNDINSIGCPRDWGYEVVDNLASICKQVGTCYDCWEREMPETKLKQEDVSIDDLKDAICSLTSIVNDVISDESERAHLDNFGIMIIDALSELEQYHEAKMRGPVVVSKEVREYIDDLAAGNKRFDETLSQSAALEIHHALHLMDAFNVSLSNNALVHTLASLLLQSEFGRCYMCQNTVKNITLDGKNNGCDGLCSMPTDATVELFLKKIVQEIELNKYKQEHN